MTTQKALLIKEKQGPFILDSTWPIPQPGAGEILIKIQAAALNPADWKIQKTGLFIQTYPTIIGFDVAGDVEEIGEGVEGFEKGDRVFAGTFFPSGSSAFQQYTLMPADLVGKMPPSLDYPEASSIPVAYATASIGLLAALPAGAGLNPTLDLNVSYSGQPVFVFGGSSSVGQFAIQILRNLNFSPIITYASGKHTSFLKSLGATHVIDRTAVPTADVPAALRQLTADGGAPPLKLVYDAISEPDTLDACFASLAEEGGIVVAVLPGEPRDEGGKKLIRIQASPHLQREFGVSMWKTLVRELEEGVIVPNRVEKLPDGLAGIPDGLKRLENNQISGVKLVALPQETA